MRDYRYIPFLLLIISFFLSQLGMAQNGDVRFFVKPENAKIILADSNLLANKVYSFPQGIYQLEISAEGFETQTNHYFQIYANKGKDYDFKLRKAREKKSRPSFVDFVVPSLVTGAVSIGLNYLIFPIQNLKDEKEKISTYENELSEKSRDLSRTSIPTWDFTIAEQKIYNELKQSYSNAISDYNKQVSKNNTNRANRIIFSSSVFSASLVFFYLKEKRVLKNNLKNTNLSFSNKDFNLTVNF